ncbi:hypothetical protein JV173_03235 [Acholeplasma equirhinis]|uniref:hypothetical protein n=1 Tax=Acholeplasma equirhinis TaxID=555393 RepID=UPI00197A7476|nr:hypothetical protein [Acholeplasma equirhinis]MBN3490523.1 hypothetical protein [Acholeplasma equirhinis]
MKKLFSIVVLIVMAAFLVSGTYQTAKSFAEKGEATTVDFKDFLDPDMVPPAGPVNP